MPPIFGKTAAVEHEAFAGIEDDIAPVAFLRNPDFAVETAHAMAAAVAHLHPRRLRQADQG